MQRALVAFGLWAALLATGCGGAPERRAKAPRPPAVPVTFDTTPAEGPRATRPDLAADVDPDAERAYRAHAAEAAVPLADGPPPLLTARALEDTARLEARGLTRDGEVRHAVLTEGQRAEVDVPLAQGDCVTVVAHGGLGVMEVDALLVAGEPGAPRLLASDTRRGQIGVVGGHHGCFAFTSGPSERARAVVQVRRGEGPAVFAVYRTR